MKDDVLDQSLFTLIGGKEPIERVHKIFYDKIYADSWIGQFFRSIDQKVIEEQQTDFIVQAMGGPKEYKGALPINAHQHMMITEELFEYRHKLLKDSIQEAGIPEALAARWLKIDYAFKTALIKKSLQDCKKRFNTDEIQDFPNPLMQYKKSA